MKTTNPIINGVRFTLETPEATGWEFLEFRKVTKDEHYCKCYGCHPEKVITWKSVYPSEGTYFIATKVKQPKQPEIERCGICLGNYAKHLRYTRSNGITYVIYEAFDDPDLLGFEFEEGIIFQTSTRPWSFELKSYINGAPPDDIKNGLVIVRHATHVLFQKENIPPR